MLSLLYKIGSIHLHITSQRLYNLQQLYYETIFSHTLLIKYSPFFRGQETKNRYSASLREKKTKSQIVKLNYI